MRSLDNPPQIASPTTGNPQFDSAAYAAFRAVFDSSSEALLIINQDGEIQTANRRATDLLSLTRQGPDAGLIRDFLAGLTSEEIRPMLRRGKTFPASASAADGASVPRVPLRVMLRAVLPVSQHLLLTLEESWNSYKTGSEERHLEAELRTILDAIQPGVLILDLQGGIRWSNPTFAHLLGLEGLDLEHV